MATSFERRRAEFGESLRQLRDAAGFNGKDFARMLGWNAPKVSKVEKGRQTASQEDLEDWIRALNVPADVAEDLRAQLSALHEQYVTWKVNVRAGHRARQEESVEREAKASRIRIVDVGVVPGLLQTADYAEHVLRAHANLHGGGQDLGAAVRSRMRRQQVLYEAGKEIDILVTESALLHPVAPPDVMTGQIHRLIATIGVPNVRFGVLPARTRLPYMLMHNYWIVDQLAMIETVTGELTVPDPDEVATYNQLTDLLWSCAVEGDEAREILHRIADELRAER